MSDASDTAAAPSTTARHRGFGCAGTTPFIDAPCKSSVTEEVDGLPLCGWHAVEFGAEARADVLEVAALYLLRWLRIAREELCNDELAWRLEAAREGLGAETERAHEALRRPGFEGHGADPRPEANGEYSAAGAGDAAESRSGRGVGARRGSRRGGRAR